MMAISSMAHPNSTLNLFEQAYMPGWRVQLRHMFRHRSRAHYWIWEHSPPPGRCAPGTSPGDSWCRLARSAAARAA
jgi:hypothetical protein